MKRRGVNCREEQIFLTAGAQQGMSLLSRLLLEPGGSVITEELIYTVSSKSLNRSSLMFSRFPTDAETGMDVDAVEQHLRGGARPSFIYAITDGHNPLSVRLHPSKRARLVELAEQYGVPIIEDDAYGFLCYENPLPPLRFERALGLLRRLVLKNSGSRITRRLARRPGRIDSASVSHQGIDGHRRRAVLRNASSTRISTRANCPHKSTCCARSTDSDAT